MLDFSPSMNPGGASRFAERLRTHQSTITEAWVKAVKSDREIASSQKLTLSELADHLPALFNGLIEYLQNSATEGTRQRVRQNAQRHGNQRWKQDYRMVELLREFGTGMRLILRDGVDRLIQV